MTLRQKKSETIEIRLAYATKQAFMARCQAAGRSASEVLRDCIADYVAVAPPRRFATPTRLAAAAAALLAAGALAGPTLARPSLPATFERLDADHDGRLSPEEFSNGAAVSVSLAGGAPRPLAAAATCAALRAEFDRVDADHDGRISFDEFRRGYARTDS